MELIFATNNVHKLKEIQALVGDYYKIKNLHDIACHEELQETSHTIEGNALQKAQYVYNHYHVNCFADDTGLEIEALEGRPGVYSARYAGEEKSSEANIQKVLYELNNIANRKARFKTVIALVLQGKEYLFEGIVNGVILDYKRGKSGFGYDPIFIPEGYTKSFAEMTSEEKNKCSHRALAVNKLIKFLQEA